MGIEIQPPLKPTAGLASASWDRTPAAQPIAVRTFGTFSPVDPFTPRVVQRLGAKTVIVAGLVSMALGLAVIALTSTTTPLPALAALMVLVGVSGPLVMPPATAILLDSVPPPGAVSRQGFQHQPPGRRCPRGRRLRRTPGSRSVHVRATRRLLTAAVVALLTAAAATVLRPVRHHTDKDTPPAALTAAQAGMSRKGAAA
ncbi:MFS transporter [Actinopolymorpha singaporensis]